MNNQQYIGLDVHKKTIWYCAKDAEGKIVREGRFAATMQGIKEWCQSWKVPWVGLMEATMFAHWIYDQMQPYAAEMRMGHPAAMKETLQVKHKSDRNDARRFAEMCRNNSVRTLYVMPAPLRALRRQLRVRNLLKRQVVQLKNRMASILMETGVEFAAGRLHTKRAYQALLDSPNTPPTIKPLLRMLCQLMRNLAEAQKAIFRDLENSPELKQRLKLLQTIPCVGRIMALTWALEVGCISRFSSHSQAVSYCGLVSAQNESAGKDKGGPLSKVRNKDLQHMLIEVGHLAPRIPGKLCDTYRKVQPERGSSAAAVAVARKLVSYLMAVDRSGQPFQPPDPALPPTRGIVGADCSEPVGVVAGVAMPTQPAA